MAKVRAPHPPDGPVRVQGSEYPPYYLDNLTARLAEAGEIESADQRPNGAAGSPHGQFP
jgi:hypothetical protein